MFSDFLYKSLCCGFELHRKVDAIQMSTHNICLYKEVDKKCTGCNLKTMELLDCAYRCMYGNLLSDMYPTKIQISQSDWFRCLYEKTLHLWLSKMHPVKILDPRL